MTDQAQLGEALAQLQDDAPAIRSAALHTLRQLRDPATIDALVWLLGDDSLWVRCTAAEALGEFHTPEVVPPLVEFLRLGTQAELQHAGVPAALPIRYHRFYRQQDAAFDNWRQEQGIQVPHEGFSLAVSARLGLQMTGIDATDALVDLLDDPNPYTQYIAVNLLNEMTIRKRPSDALLLALTEESATKRLNAARALGKLGNMRAVRPLSALLHDEDTGVRATAAEALGSIQDKRAIPALTQALQDPETHHAAWLALHSLNIAPDDINEADK